jgi:anti-anti-sigma factor
MSHTLPSLRLDNPPANSLGTGALSAVPGAVTPDRGHADSHGHIRGVGKPRMTNDLKRRAGTAVRSEAQLMGDSEIDCTLTGAPSPLKIAVRANGTTTELVVCGEWDLAQQLRARKAISAALDRCPECVVLDLSGLSFIDSSGIHNTIELHRRCVQQGIHLVIISGPRAVQRPFEICGLTDRLPFLGSGA